MELTMLQGYPDRVGRRLIWAAWGNGPAPYVNTGTFATSGDPMDSGFIGFQNYIDVVIPAMSVSGTYIVRGVPVHGGNRPQIQLHWFTASSGTEVTNGTDLSAEEVQLAGFGGTF